MCKLAGLENTCRKGLACFCGAKQRMADQRCLRTFQTAVLISLARSFHYVKSYADGTGVVRLPMGIV